MIIQIHSILQSMIEFSKQKTNHLEFIKRVHSLLYEKFNLPDSLFILSLGDHFLKSYWQKLPEEYWDIRTNELDDSDRFLRLVGIVEREIGFSKQKDLRLEIIESNEIIGIIIVPNCSSLPNRKETKEILNGTKDLFYLICKSLYRQFQLNERVKELSCLHKISKLAENKELSIHDFLTEVVKLLPPAWQHPEQAQARITYNSDSFVAQDFEESDLSIKAEIVVDNRKTGLIEVSYPPDFRHLDSLPFLKEEEHLMETIAQELNIVLDKKKAEEESRKLGMQLLHADRLATLGQLSAGIAHEINEPLAGILGLAQLMEKNESLDIEAKNDLENIVSASLHAREVVKKLMLFARQMPSSQTRINLNDAVKNAIFFLESRCRKNMIKVKIDLAKDIPDIIADSSQIHQVLINLVVNALQAMPDGGEIILKTGFDAENVFLECSDTGIGMNKEVLSQIFNPFFTTKKVNEGTGLGLSVVHGIIYSHNGSIKVKSKPNEGSKFMITFPGALKSSD
ncbi:MAG: ATP-binding protein [Candidatus Cloacimonadales bacterium]|nr:ATP-binding protein [Candidatus Cloacimonadales bacterium]